MPEPLPRALASRMLRRVKDLRSVRLLALLAVFGLLLAGFSASQLAFAQPEGGSPLSGAAPPQDDPPVAGDDVPSAQPGDQLRAYVLTFTPGDHPFYKFGHNAILIRDASKRIRERDKVYNYGTFSFGDPALIPKFFFGRFMYWLSWQSLPATMAGYSRERRGIDAQELDLDGPTKAELQRLLDENLLNENKYYKYDYYRDNCSTRVRDMIDRATGGALKAQLSGPARLTYRQHTLRLTESLPLEYVVLHVMMGDLIDKPITEWDEAFIPMELQKSLRKVKLTGPDGRERPIVREEKLLLRGRLPMPPDDPPTTWPYALLAGLLTGGGLLALGRRATGSRVSRVAFGLALSFFGLLWGFFGWASLTAWAITDHAVGYANENLLLCVPWAIVLVGSGIGVARGRASSTRRAYKLVLAAAAAAALALAVKVLPWFDQDNTFFLAFFVPFWAGAFVGLRSLVELTAVGAPADPKSKSSKSDDQTDDEATASEDKSSKSKAQPSKSKTSKSKAQPSKSKHASTESPNSKSERPEPEDEASARTEATDADERDSKDPDKS